ncbi:MAG TPA: ankyrin repeat domain-containing protein [Thermoanaerobaculia bacterium]|nr:ankyrin repeat domain-containing protein [Thermoanaerobaculia bacterium]
MNEFFEAIQKGDAARVAELLTSDKTLLDARQNNATPILVAIYHGKPEIARLLADSGAKVSIAEACALGDSDRVRSMLDADPQSLHSRSEDGYPCLGLAVFFRNGELARDLIARGADVNAAANNAQRVAPVHAAAAVCDHETMRALLERGADPNARQQMHYAALHGAASRGDIEMAKLLLAHGADRDAKASDGMTPADVATKYGKAEFAEWIRSVVT